MYGNAPTGVQCSDMLLHTQLNTYTGRQVILYDGRICYKTTLQIIEYFLQ
jgi:hypothetical protein